MGPYLSSKGALWHRVGRRKYSSGQGLAVATPWVPAIRWAMGEGGRHPHLPILHLASPYGLRHTMESDRRVMELQS